MSAITVNAFPPLHAFSSSRSWVLALIVLLHAGFFWLLTHGVTFGIIKTEHKTWVVDVPIDIVDPEPVVPPEPREINSSRVDPLPLPNEIDYREKPQELAPEAGPRVDSPPTAPTEAGPGSGPRILEPQVDPRFPFTEPEYPVSEIRQGHEGTVLLALQILPNGRVGAVRIDQSSGYEKLDDAAAREARRWRMKPGTSDGTATPMWKRVPIKFQLKN